MKTVIIDESKKSEWEQYIYDNPNSVPGQSYEWSSLLRRHYSFDFYPIAAVEDTKICGILPLYHLTTASGKDVLISAPYAVNGGILADNEQAAQVLFEKAKEISKKHNGCPITLKQYKIRIAGDMRIDDSYYNRQLNVARNSSDIWKEISEQNRHNIEETMKHELVLEYPSRDVNGFYKLLLRYHHKKGVPCVNQKWIEDLIEYRMSSIAILRSNNHIVAATMVKDFRDWFSFPFTCVPDTTDKATLFAYGLYWQLILRFTTEGKRIFHSGRIPNTDQTDIYRLGWGGTRYDYCYHYYPNTTVKTDFTRKRGWKRDLFEKLWRMVPEPVAGALGPSIVKRFP
ncbi:MAG: hypothetical protein M0R70_01020 [Nitrospirae bacterium]|nr:hypothetical protein [Nitrospirota bacterium]